MAAIAFTKDIWSTDVHLMLFFSFTALWIHSTLHRKCMLSHLHQFCGSQNAKHEAGNWGDAEYLGNTQPNARRKNFGHLEIDQVNVKMPANHPEHHSLHDTEPSSPS